MSMNFELNVFNIILLVITLLLLVMYILNSIKLTKLRKNYSYFIVKLEKGNDINTDKKDSFFWFFSPWLLII